MKDTALARSHLALLQTVRCLECGEVYSKPVEGGTVSQNPGCPSCGYVGWLSLSLPAPRRSAAGHGAAGHSEAEGFTGVYPR